MQVFSGRRMESGEPRAEGGEREGGGRGWWLVVGGWRLAVGGWRLAVGGWRLRGVGEEMDFKRLYSIIGNMPHW